MSFNPKTGGPAGFPTTDAEWRAWGDVIREQNQKQYDMIARGEIPDYYPDQPLPRRRNPNWA